MEENYSYIDYLDPDLDMPTMRHFLSLQALQAVRFFLSTTHLGTERLSNSRRIYIGWRGARAILMKYARWRSMEDVVNTPSH
jgi:hypothetical protein